MSETKCLGDNHKVLVTDLTEYKSLIGSPVLHSGTTFHDTSSRREKYTGGVKVVGGMKWKNRIRREMLTGMKSLVGLNDSYTMSQSMK